jgi:hypothetical protein
MHRRHGVRMNAAGAFRQAFPPGRSHRSLVCESDPKFAKLKKNHFAFWIESEIQCKRTRALGCFRPWINHCLPHRCNVTRQIPTPPYASAVCPVPDPEPGSASEFFSSPLPDQFS